MIKTTLNWTVRNLKTMHDSKETLSFNHPIQRQSSQWDCAQQSLLIHSMLANFPVPAIYVEKREMVEADEKGKHSYSYSVLDGKQRMTSTFSFINGEYALASDTPAVIIDGTMHEIADKFFDELEEDVQQEILRFRFTITCFEDVTNEEIEEIFFRLNNSTPLSKPQKSRPLMGVSNSIFVNDILAGRFFREKCNFSQKQLKASDDMCTLLQAMMLLDAKHRGYEYKDISADSVMTYSKHIKNNYPDECKEHIMKIIGFLDNCFYMKERTLKKINIPIIFLMADEALERSITNSQFRTWYHCFLQYCKEDYSQYCSSGSIKKEKVLGRINVMSDAFEKYFAPIEDDADESSCDIEDNLRDNINSNIQSDDEEFESADIMEDSSEIEDADICDNDESFDKKDSNIEEIRQYRCSKCDLIFTDSDITGMDEDGNDLCPACAKPLNENDIEAYLDNQNNDLKESNEPNDEDDVDLLSEVS